jgi:hypothetical protein
MSDTGYITSVGISTGDAKHAFELTEVPDSVNPEPEALPLLIFGLIRLNASRQLNPRRATRCLMSQNI